MFKEDLKRINLSVRANRSKRSLRTLEKESNYFCDNPSIDECVVNLTE